MKRQYTIAIVWAAVMAVHTAFIYVVYGFSIFICLFDSFVFNLLFSLLALGLWFFTSVYDLSTRRTADLFINHFTAAALSILAWVSASVFLLELFFSDESGYMAFLENSVPFRAVLGILFYAVTVWVYYLMRTLEKAKWQAQQQEKITSLLKDAELKALRSQVNPHFLFNSLNSIHSLTMSDPEKAGEMILKLSDLMRYSLSKQEEMVSFGEEIKQVKRYLDIEKIRFSERLTVDFEIDNNAEPVKVPSMILQPLLENAVKYGIYGVEKGVRIKFTAAVEDTMLVVEIVNNYDPFAAVKHGTGMGLNNVKERLSVVFHRTDLVSVNKTNEYFVVVLKIPAIQQ